jgi:hypothetical protein
MGKHTFKGFVTSWDQINNQTGMLFEHNLRISGGATTAVTPEEATRICERAAVLDPRRAAIGIRIGGSFPGDPHVFSWFESLETAAKFVSETNFIALNVEDDARPTLPDYYDRVLSLLKTKSGHAELREMHDQEYGRQCGYLDWIGTFKDLAEGDDELAVEIRSSFNEDESSMPITPSNYDAFVQYLLSYGL